MFKLDIILISILIGNSHSQTNNGCAEFKEVSTNVINGVQIRATIPATENQFLYGPLLYMFAECQYDILRPGTTLDLMESYKLSYIIFKNSYLIFVPDSLFSAMPNLKQLYLNDSSVEIIEHEAFKNVPNLLKLHLEHNLITEINNKTFTSLNNLIKLDLSYNKLHTLESNALGYLTSVEDLNLSHNNITTLPDYLFTGLNAIRLIDISYNRLKDISENLFSNIFNAEATPATASTIEAPNKNEICINLSYNELVVVDFSFFPTVSQNLNVEFNQIATLRNLRHMRNLKQLNLSFNKLNKIIYINENLTYFNIRGNYLNEINSTLFKDSFNLEIVDLSRNRIHSLRQKDLANLTNLRELHLEENLLNYIPPGSFRNLHHVEFLNLSFNQLNQMQLSTFYGLYNLKYLDLSNNSFNNFLENSFQNLKHLEVLNISNNLITTLETNIFLQNVNSLRVIAINHNRWYCKSLEKIVNDFQNRNVLVVKGNIHYMENNINGIFCVNYDENPVMRPTERSGTPGFTYPGTTIRTTTSRGFTYNGRTTRITTPRYFTYNRTTTRTTTPRGFTYPGTTTRTTTPRGFTYPGTTTRTTTPRGFTYPGTTTRTTTPRGFTYPGTTTRTTTPRGFTYNGTTTRTTTPRFKPFVTTTHAFRNRFPTTGILTSAPFYYSSKISRNLTTENNTESNIHNDFETALNKYLEHLQNGHSHLNLSNALNSSLALQLKYLETVDKGFQNSSFYKYLNNSLPNQSTHLKALDTEFTNTTFYKYLNREFNKSELFKYLNEDMPAMLDSYVQKISAQFTSIRDYFDNGFKNSTFHKFMIENNMNYSIVLKNADKELTNPVETYNNILKNVIPNIHVPGPNLSLSSFAKYQGSSSSVDAKEILLKMDQLQTGVVGLMVVVVLLLLSLFVLLVYKNVSNRVTKKIQRLSGNGANDIHESTTGLVELT